MAMRAGPFGMLVLATVFVFTALQVVNWPLRDAAVAPVGIISFQFAGTVPQAQAMLDLWASRGVLPHAAFSTGLDCLFPVLYGTALAFACFWAAVQWEWRSPALARLMRLLAWGQWLAGGLDLVENTAQAVMILSGQAAAPLPELIWWCAGSKFALVGAGLLTAAAGAAASLLFREAPLSPSTGQL